MPPLRHRHLLLFPFLFLLLPGPGVRGTCIPIAPEYHLSGDTYCRQVDQRPTERDDCTTAAWGINLGNMTLQDTDNRLDPRGCLVVFSLGTPKWLFWNQGTGPGNGSRLCDKTRLCMALCERFCKDIPDTAAPPTLQPSPVPDLPVTAAPQTEVPGTKPPDTALPQGATPSPSPPATAAPIPPPQGLPPVAYYPPAATDSASETDPQGTIFVAHAPPVPPPPPPPPPSSPPDEESYGGEGEGEESYLSLLIPMTLLGLAFIVLCVLQRHRVWRRKVYRTAGASDLHSDSASAAGLRDNQPPRQELTPHGTASTSTSPEPNAFAAILQR